MVTIKKIEIKDYFGRGNFEWNLDPVVNILGGKNGSGKSTLFKFCYILLTEQEIDDATDKKFSQLFQSAIITLSNGWILTWNSQNGFVDYGVRIGSNSTIYRVGATSLHDEEGNSHNLSDITELTRILLINSFEQQVEKAIQYEQKPKSLSLVDPTILDLMIQDQIDLRNRIFSATMEGFMDESVESIEGINKYKKIHNKVYNSLSHFMKDYEKKITSNFDFTKDGENISWQNLSMGEKQILLLLLTVSNTKQQPCIFFMDEPDLSMHIDWKEILVKELHELNPNMQIILSTHAPSVITGWMDRVEEVSHLIKK